MLNNLPNILGSRGGNLWRGEIVGEQGEWGGLRYEGNQPGLPARGGGDGQEGDMCTQASQAQEYCSMLWQ